jgi:hypothetical protein
MKTNRLDVVLLGVAFGLIAYGQARSARPHRIHVQARFCGVVIRDEWVTNYVQSCDDPDFAAVTNLLRSLQRGPQ